MVALFLACLGSGYLYHGFINQKNWDIAILVSMGATKSALRPYFAQLFLLGISAVIPSVVLCMFVIPALSGALGTFVPIDVQARITFSSVVLATIVAIFGGWLIVFSQVFGKYAAYNLRIYFESQAITEHFLVTSFSFYLLFQGCSHSGCFVSFRLTQRN